MLTSGLAILPFASAVALWFTPSGWLRARLDLGACAAGLLLVILLTFQGDEPLPLLTADRLAVLVALLAMAVAVLTRWGTLRNARQSAPALAAGQAVLGGVILAAVAADPLLLWCAIVIVAAGASFSRIPRAPDRAMLLAAAMSFALFGLIAWHAQPGLLAIGCMIIGYGTVVVLVPEALVLLLLVPRIRALAADMAWVSVMTDTLLMGAGLGILLSCAVLSLTLSGGRRRAGGTALSVGMATPQWSSPLWSSPLWSSAPWLSPLGRMGRRRVALLVLGQAGVGVFAFGLGSAEASLAACIHLILLILTRSAADLAPDGGTERLLALLGLAGLPPLGVFPGLVLVFLATIEQAVWLLPLCAGIGILAWVAIRHIMPFRWARPRPSGAWIPLALALLLGLVLPQPVAVWLQSAATP